MKSLGVMPFPCFPSASSKPPALWLPARYPITPRLCAHTPIACRTTSALMPSSITPVTAVNFSPNHYTEYIFFLVNEVVLRSTSLYQALESKNPICRWFSTFKNVLKYQLKPTMRRLNTFDQHLTGGRVARRQHSPHRSKPDQFAFSLGARVLAPGQIQNETIASLPPCITQQAIL